MEDLDDILDRREYGLNTADHFAKHGWTYIPNFVEKYECDALTDHMFRLKEQGKMKADKHCPMSLGVYGDPILDSFLEMKRVKLSKMIKIRLLPTYTFARLYQTNETLFRHKDRPSCEISATVTLGHDKNSEIWPFFFSKIDGYRGIHRQVIDVGGAVIYRGMELWHWRQEYKGKWQTQVFLHYVDANGSNADQAYDGRANLGDKKRIKKVRY